MEPKKVVLIAFGELFLKSQGVKDLFQKRLLRNISFFLKKANLEFKIHSSRNRIFIQADSSKKALKILKRVFGIAWFTEALFFPDAGLKDISNFIGQNYSKWISKDQTFALRVRRENSDGLETRSKIIDQVAEKIKRKVNLNRPNKEIFIEKRKTSWFLYFKKARGSGGLPVGSEGKVLCLLSGGIDSVPASILISKRGAENIWLHFHSYPLVSKASCEKVKELADVFLNFQPKIKIYFVPFASAQTEIKTKIPAKYRIVLYRRLMLKIAKEIAKKENCQALVTGESLGQVSSQTLSNIEVVEESVKIPVFRPLIGMDKEEIIAMAKNFGTYEISIKPQEDTCSLFVPKHPTAKAKLADIKELEKQLNTKKIIKQAVEKAKIAVY